MKAVIIKINKNKAVMLKDDGSFISVSNRNYQVGQVLKLQDKSSTSKISNKFIRAAAVAACFLFICFGLTYAYNIPQSYVSLDINPSIELNINMFNRVINATGVNDDGVTVLENLEIKNRSMEGAIQVIMYQLNIDGYIDENEEKTVVVAVHCSNHEKEKRVIENARLQIEQSLNDFSVSTTVSIVSVDKETINNAHNMGTTGGKLDLAEEYAEATGNEKRPQDIVEMPVNELTKAIENANSGNAPEHANNDKDNTQENGDDSKNKGHETAQEARENSNGNSDKDKNNGTKNDSNNTKDDKDKED